MSFLNIIFVSLLFSVSVWAKKNSVEDIFIWKVSDELKLSPQEEKKFADIHRDLNKQKAELQTSLSILSYEKKSDTLKKYKSTLIEYNNLSIKEFDKIKGLLGEKRFLEYLSLKQDINTKLKSLVLGEEVKVKPSKLPPPQIIEEK